MGPAWRWYTSRPCSPRLWVRTSSAPADVRFWMRGLRPKKAVVSPRVVAISRALPSSAPFASPCPQAAEMPAPPSTGYIGGARYPGRASCVAS